MFDVAIRKKLGDFSLDVRFASEAPVTALFGPSGSGKTSVANAISGLLQPDAGKIEGHLGLPPQLSGSSLQDHG